MNAAAQRSRATRQRLKLLRYGAYGVAFFFWVSAFRNASIFQNIEFQIAETRSQTEKLQEQIDYEKNFLKKYLESPRYDYFFAREQNQISDGDQLLIFLQESDLETEKILRATESSTGALSPSQKRQNFFREKRRENES